jgi:predicted MFS family arabinose efflux permease
MTHPLRAPVFFLMAINFINLLGYSGWNGLFNNFAKEAADFTGYDIGIAQSVREIPGFLAFTAIVWFLVMREQIFALVSLIVLGAGCVATGYLPSFWGILISTTIMSVGFHYSETVNQSLALQLFPKKDAPRLLGRVAGAGAAAQLTGYGGMALLWWAGLRDYRILYGLLGALCIGLTIFAFFWFPKVEGTVPQRKSIVLRPRYWLYYALTLMSGARRQIFSAFAAFLLVERFGMKVHEVAGLFLITAALNIVLAPWFGSLIGRIGERRTIMLENIVLIVVFAGYATTDDPLLAAALFVLDGVFMTLVIAQRTYFQKIGDASDFSPTAAVAFTINHIAAVFIPFVLGMLWLKDPALVFQTGTVIATISLGLAFIVPRDPGHGRETVFKENAPEAAQAA